MMYFWVYKERKYASMAGMYQWGCDAPNIVKIARSQSNVSNAAREMVTVVPVTHFLKAIVG